MEVHKNTDARDVLGGREAIHLALLPVMSVEYAISKHMSLASVVHFPCKFYY